MEDSPLINKTEPNEGHLIVDTAKKLFHYVITKNEILVLMLTFSKEIINKIKAIPY